MSFVRAAAPQCIHGNGSKKQSPSLDAPAAPVASKRALHADTVLGCGVLAQCHCRSAYAASQK